MADTTGWRAPRRPEWVARVNAEADCLDLPALVPLDADSLLDWARRNTGLDDFGGDAWREPFSVLLHGLETEADLHLMGRMAARTEILNWLQNRLKITDLLKRNPDIHDVVIDRPLFIIGTARSGTTILYELLAQDERFRVLLGWEAVFPVPPSQAATCARDPRIEQADRLLTQINRIVPEHEAMHDIGGNIPIECGQIMGHSFIADQIDAFYQSPSYSQWIMSHDWTPAYEYHRTILKILQYRNPKAHWLLKAPNHMTHIPELLKIYPDARFIQTHRDPLKTMASVTSLLGTLYWAKSDQQFNSSAFEDLMLAPGMAAQLEGVMALRDEGVIREDAITDIVFAQLVDDPLAALELVYERLGLSFDAAQRRKVMDYLASKQGASHGSHRYDDPSPERVARDRPYFTRYQARYGVPDEIKGQS
ncbi:sulfotransferase family protein [Sphingobium estronivorans]|uniref:sulfotransferase family protein n=1 Tax=Sphingobium estronivorans TaxID=1577690 RepID=UPI00123921B0|nr:sulfotransferase [Sphingobium estronivorans]